MKTIIQPSNSLICLFCEEQKENIYCFSIRISTTYETSSIHVCVDCLLKNIPELNQMKNCQNCHHLEEVEWYNEPCYSCLRNGRMDKDKDWEIKWKDNWHLKEDG